MRLLLIFLFETFCAQDRLLERIPFRSVKTQYRHVELYLPVTRPNSEFFHRDAANQLCKSNGMRLPDPLDLNESIAIFKDEKGENFPGEVYTGITRKEVVGKDIWLTHYDNLAPNISWSSRFDSSDGFSMDAQHHPLPREDFGLCLVREYTENSDALLFNICDNRTIGSFLCEDDNRDFALKTFLNKTFIELYGDYIYDDHILTESSLKEMNINSHEFRWILNRSPRRILDAAAQCKSEDSTLHHPSTMNTAYYKEYILPRISVDILWLNGYQKDINIWELESSPMGDFTAAELCGGPRLLFKEDLPEENLARTWLQLSFEHYIPEAKRRYGFPYKYTVRGKDNKLRSTTKLTQAYTMCMKVIEEYTGIEQFRIMPSFKRPPEISILSVEKTTEMGVFLKLDRRLIIAVFFILSGFISVSCTIFICIISR